MNIHAGTKENRCTGVNSLTGRAAGAPLAAHMAADNRPAARQQRRMQEIADNRPQAILQRKMQEIADNSNRAPIVQRYTVAEDPAGKFSTDHLMFVDAQKSLFADPDKVQQANAAVADSPITFGSNEEDIQHGLMKVTVTKDAPAPAAAQPLQEGVVAEGGEHEDELVVAQPLQEGVEAEGDGHEDELVVAQPQILAAAEYVAGLLASDLLSLEAIQASHVGQTAVMQKALGDEFIDALEEFHGKGVEGHLRPALTRFRTYLGEVGASPKILLPSDCGLFAGMLMDIHDTPDTPDEDGIGLQTPDARVTAVDGGVAVPGTAAYVQGPVDPLRGVVYHWGTTIMADGADTVTMEGAVGMHADFPKIENDNTWKFEMYGTENANDSFVSLNAHYFAGGVTTQSGAYSKTPEG